MIDQQKVAFPKRLSSLTSMCVLLRISTVEFRRVNSIVNPITATIVHEKSLGFFRAIFQSLTVLQIGHLINNGYTKSRSRDLGLI